MAFALAWAVGIAPLAAEEPGRWALSADNDALTGATEDRDYTAGFGFALTGPAARRFARPNGRALEWLDRRTGAARLHRAERAPYQQDGAQIALLMFTPDDIGNANLIRTDRPYASLALLEHSHYGVAADQRVMYESTFAFGVIGSSFAESLQRRLHRAIGDKEPRGYRYQISDGGELTARYGFARHGLVAAGGGKRRHDVHYTLGASVGYLTEVVAGIGMRWGALASPWWNGMHAGSYAVGGAASRFDGHSGDDFYFWAGMSLRTRAYNVLLQGQFRDSALVYRDADLERFVLEAGVGATKDFGRLKLTYAIRYQTPELEEGPGVRPIGWAGITLSGNR